MARFVVLMLAACLLVEATALAAAAEVEMRPIVVDGEAAWGDPGGSFSAVGVPTINQAGVIGFAGRALVSGIHLEGLYQWIDGTGERLAQEGELIGQHPTITYRSFETPVIEGYGTFFNDSGQLAFHARFEDGSSAMFLARINRELSPASADGRQTRGRSTLLEVLRRWGSTGEEHGGDLDCSGRVDFDDLLEVLDGWGMDK